MIACEVDATQHGNNALLTCTRERWCLGQFPACILQCFKLAGNRCEVKHTCRLRLQAVGCLAKSQHPAIKKALQANTEVCCTGLAWLARLAATTSYPFCGLMLPLTWCYCQGPSAEDWFKLTPKVIPLCLQQQRQWWH